jgi:uncharacterized protein YjbJ (UPF0337 family)
MSPGARNANAGPTANVKTGSGERSGPSVEAVVSKLISSLSVAMRIGAETCAWSIKRSKLPIQRVKKGASLDRELHFWRLPPTTESSMTMHRVLSVLSLAAAIGVAGCQNRETEKGDINKAKGDAEQDVGKAVGSDSLTNAGKSDEAKGKLQKAAGDVEHAVKP